MSDIDNQFTEAKVSGTVPVETAMLALSLLLFVQQNPDLLQLLACLMMNDQSNRPTPDELKKKIELPLKQAAELLVTAQVLNGFVRHRTPERAVTFLYIVFRYALYVGNTPTREQSIELWQQVWSTARQFPIVAHEYEQREQAGNLKDWIDEVQGTARRQLRTFKRQLPRIQKNIAATYNKAYQAFLGET